MIFRYRDIFEYVHCGLETPCIVGMQPEWLVGFLVDFCPVGWLSGCLLCCLLGWSDDWLSGCLLGSLLGWLAGWLLVWLYVQRVRENTALQFFENIYKKWMQMFDKAVWKWRKDVTFIRRREMRWRKSCTLGKNSTEKFWYWTAEETEENF